MNTKIKNFWTKIKYSWTMIKYSWTKINVSEIWSKYQKCSQRTRNMVTIPEICSKYQNYGQNTRSVVNIPEIWPPYQKYGQHTANEKKLKYLNKNIRRLRVWKRKRKQARVRSIPIGSVKNQVVVITRYSFQQWSRDWWLVGRQQSGLVRLTPLEPGSFL